MEKWTYTFLLAGSIIIPLLRSFEPRINFRAKWPALFAGIFVMMLVFIPWDIWFTNINTWYFNKRFVTGIYIAGLPLEEWLFFIVIPYACLFTYEVLRYFLPRFNQPFLAKYFTLLLAFLFSLIALLNTDKIYTVIVFSLAALLLYIQLLNKTDTKWLSHFWLTYLVILIPFTIVNGFLTASPVVIYDNNENLFIRISTIPVEDFAYLLSMLLIVISVYEGLRKKPVKQAQTFR